MLMLFEREKELTENQKIRFSYEREDREK